MILVNRPEVDVVVAVVADDGSIAEIGRNVQVQRLVWLDVTMVDLVDDIDHDVHHESEKKNEEGQPMVIDDDCRDSLKLVIVSLSSQRS